MARRVVSVERRSVLHGVAVALVVISFVLLSSSKSMSRSFVELAPDYAPVVGLLPRYEGESGDPDLGGRTTVVDVGAVRRASEYVSDDAVYYVHAPESDSGSIRRVARLYFLPALEVVSAVDADWILSVRARSLPPGVSAAQTIPLARGVSLVRVRAV